MVAGSPPGQAPPGSKQVTFPKRHFIGKVPVQSIRWKRPRARPTDARRRQQAADRAVRAERLALYGLPDFDDFQRAEFFALTAAERALVERRKGLAEQVWCLLQIGYFKAKQAFFSFSWPDVPAGDIAFLMERYFPGSALTPQPIRANEHYAQRREIAGLFGYRLWSDTDRAVVVGKAGLWRSGT